MMKLWTMAVIFAMVAGCAGPRPERLGVADGKLTPCPSSPNCVCSQSQDKLHAIDPIAYEGPPEAAWTRLITVIRSMKRAKVVRTDEGYLHVEFTSAVFRFVDDVEFYLDATQSVIQVRSASRLGYSDFGVNRKRVETIRMLFRQLP
jgi:uncharacterized protein (DUF1499 family)